MLDLKQKHNVQIDYYICLFKRFVAVCLNYSTFV